MPRFLRVAGLLLALACAAAGETSAASKGRLSANQFLSLDAFIVPMMPEGEMRRQFTLVVALELKDQDDRDFVKSQLPRLRSQVYDLLFRLIAYRTQEPFVPSTSLLKKKVFDIAVAVVGGDKVESVVVQQVYQGRTP
jgi:flagellar basal body-associated protein FliL